jgi:Homeodomain-like domain
MPRALAVPLRQVLLRRWRRGQSVPEIAAVLGLPARTVRHLIRQFRQGSTPADALAPQYPRCGRRRSWPNQLLVEHALNLRRHHPHWGAGLIRVFLKQRWRRQPLPTERTLQRWFHRAGLGPAARGRRPKGIRRRADEPHDVWQMDAVEQIRLGSGQRVSWLRLCDEYTGAMLYSKVFPVGRWSQVGGRAVQEQLRQAFTRWGRPRRLRVDNGAPWGSAGDLPTPLALWVLGLDVALTWNRPRRPRDNAVVERSQGVSQRWVEPHTCADAQELQRRLDRMDGIQRDQYPSKGGQSRTHAYPRLAHARRDYSSRWEARHWSLPRILESLSEYAVVRRVDRCGKVWLYDRSYAVGKAWAEHEVYVTLDAETREWSFQDATGHEIRRQPARQLTRANVRTLQIGRSAAPSRHGGKIQGRQQRQNYMSHLTAKLTVG